MICFICEHVLFQFQFGSINRRTGSDSTKAFTEFQFQFGSINSESAILKSNLSILFQFQFGSINRAMSEQITESLEEFQFQFGSINSATRTRPQTNSSGVSIPIWFD